MTIETVKMSSKGQIVIPFGIRKTIQANEGSVFAVIENADSIILKKVKMPSKEELISDLKKISIDGKKRLEEKGIKEEDISKIVEHRRKKI